MMKKLIPLLVIGALLGGCSGLSNIRLPQLGASPTVPPGTDTSTARPSSTPSPTQNLFATSTSTPLTFTPTVTLMGAENFTPTNTPTLFPTQSLPTPIFVTPGAPSDPSNIFTPESTGFLTILTSSNLMYWNEGPCSPREIKFNVFVVDPANTDKVLLFTRLREKRNTLNETAWNSGAIMIREENDSFSYTVHTWNLRRYYYFREAWLEYQLVALDEELHEVGRTPIYDRNLSLARCQPVP